MDRMKYKRWSLIFDREATAKAYEAVAEGGADECHCSECANFAAARSQAYPSEVKDLLNTLGIPLQKEAEAWWKAPQENGDHLYLTWFHFVGQIESGTDAQQLSHADEELQVFHPAYEKVTDTCAIGITDLLSLVPESFGEMPVVQVEIDVEVPWVINQPVP